MFSVDVDTSVTISSSVVADDVAHILRSKKIQSSDISFATSTQDFKLNNDNNGKFVCLFV